MTENKAFKQAVRDLAARDNLSYADARRRLVAEARRDDEPQIAERDWSTRARVCIRAEQTVGAVNPAVPRTFRIGDELTMIQWGRAGRPVERDSWWTSTDIDGAHIIAAEHVEVLEILEQNPPTYAEAALPAEQVTELLGPTAAAWTEQGILVVPHLWHLEIRAADGELLGVVEADRTGRPRTPLVYRAVVGQGSSFHPRTVPMPEGFVPPRPQRAAQSERQRWASPSPAAPPAPSPGGNPAEPAEEPYRDGLCGDCTCCREGYCHTGADSDCTFSDRLGDYLCPCTGG